MINNYFKKISIVIIAIGFFAIVQYAHAAVNVVSTIQASAHMYTPTLTIQPVIDSGNKIVYFVDEQSAPANTSYLAALSMNRYHSNHTDPTIPYGFDVVIGTDPGLIGAQTFQNIASGTLPNTGDGWDVGFTYDVNFLGLSPATKYYFKFIDTKYHSETGILSIKTSGINATPQLSISLQALGQNPSATVGKYSEHFKVASMTPLDASETVNLKLFKASAPSVAISQNAVIIPAGNNFVGPSVDELDPGSYIAQIYNGTVLVSNNLNFTITAPGASSLLIEDNGQNNSTTLGKYLKQFKLSAPTPLVNVASATLKITKEGQTAALLEIPVTLPTGANAVYPGVEPLDAGAYIATVSSPTTLLSNALHFAVLDTNSAFVGGVSINFPKAQQEINNTTATLHGIVSVKLTMPIKLTYVWAPAGSPLANETNLLEVPDPGMQPGATQNVTIPFTGLTNGGTYVFAIKNKITNSMSLPQQFTTGSPTTAAKGLSYAGALFTYTPGPGGYGTPPPAGPVVDTVSGTGIVPKCGRTPGPGVPDAETRMCGYKDFLKLISNLIDYGIIIIGPIIAAVAMYAGVMIIWLGKLPDKTSMQMNKLREYQAMFVRAGIGILIILVAWVFVATVLKELGVKSDYILLDLLN